MRDNVRLTKILLTLLVFWWLVHGCNRRAMEAAMHQVATTRGAYQQKAALYQSRMDELAKIQARHPAAYFKGIKLNEANSGLQQVAEMLQKADASHSASEKSDLADEAQQILARSGDLIVDNTAYFKELDTAQAQYRNKVSELRLQALDCGTYIEGRIRAGYFSAHFSQAIGLLAQATDSWNKAQDLANRPFEKNWPDYLQTYHAALEGEKLVRQARAAADAVLQRQANNNSRLQALRDRVARLDAREGGPAADAAESLIDYPAYQCGTKLLKVGDWLKDAPAALARIAALNGMGQQRFDAAAERLDKFNAALQAKEQELEAIIALPGRVRAAIGEMGGARDAARRAMDSAASDIRSESGYDQRDARHLLRLAREEFDDAGANEAGDPLKALAGYHAAAGMAAHAAGAVVYPTATPRPTATSRPRRDDDDDDGHWSSSHSSSGSSGHSYGSGSRSHGPSGSKSSGPSGSRGSGGI